MKLDLRELIASISGVTLALPAKDGAGFVSSMTYDSRLVTSGALFVAVEGFSVDGHRFVASAADGGATAVLVSENRLDEFRHLAERGISVLVSRDTRRSLSDMAAAFYGFPSRKMKLIGITGTNGKTSTTYMIESILKEYGVSVGLIGTVNTRWQNKNYPSFNTTPESLDLQRILSEMYDDGVEYVVLEVSSHALALERVSAIDFDAAAFTNLTAEHLDFHPDMDGYFNAKIKLFDLLDESRKKNKYGLINIDDAYGKRIFSSRSKYSYQLDGFGFNTEAKYRAEQNSLENKINGLSYTLESPFAGERIKMQMSGGFQLYNSLTALSVLSSMGIPFAQIQKGLASISGVPGRFEVIGSESGITAVIDYAHTGDALEKLLSSVEQMRAGRIITVFGCGGDRDNKKRPVMGAIASSKSDMVFVTSDNPRTENPDSIISDILAGINKSNYTVITDRRSAIEEAVFAAEPGDIVVIAGKGHEDYQILGKEKIHFDDREEARKALQKRGVN